MQQLTCILSLVALAGNILAANESAETSPATKRVAIHPPLSPLGIAYSSISRSSSRLTTSQRFKPYDKQQNGLICSTTPLSPGMHMERRLFVDQSHHEYLVVSRLGQGANGVVYEAVKKCHRSSRLTSTTTSSSSFMFQASSTSITTEKIALKQVFAPSTTTSSGLLETCLKRCNLLDQLGWVMDSVKRESEFLSRLGLLYGAPIVLTSGSFIPMKFIKGTDLKTYLKTNKAGLDQRKLDLIYSSVINDAFATIHKANILHNDAHLENILISFPPLISPASTGAPSSMILYTQLIDFGSFSKILISRTEEKPENWRKCKLARHLDSFLGELAFSFDVKDKVRDIAMFQGAFLEGLIEFGYASEIVDYFMKKYHSALDGDDQPLLGFNG